MSEQREKKVVCRNVAIGLGIICTILVVGLVGAIENYTSTVNSLTHQRNQLQTLLDRNEILLYQTQAYLNSNITHFQAQISILNATLKLEDSELMGSDSPFVATVRNETELTALLPYAGYVTVQIEPPNNTYAWVLYSFQGFAFDYKTPVNAEGIGIVPVLPSDVIIGEGNLTIGTTYTVLTFYYHY
jgi:hypothetical protein